MVAQNGRAGISRKLRALQLLGPMATEEPSAVNTVATELMSTMDQQLGEAVAPCRTFVLAR